MLRVSLAVFLLLFTPVNFAQGHGEEAESGAAASIHVNTVNPGSPAAAAGLQPDDRLVSLASQEIVSLDDLKRIMGTGQPGDTVSLVVQRDGEMVDLDLTYGGLPGGGVSLGLTLNISMEGGDGDAGDPDVGTMGCLTWVEDTYRIDFMLEKMALELDDVYEEIRICIGRDTRRMSTTNAIKFCDNVFKVHCSGVDLLTEIAEMQVEGCRDHLNETMGEQLEKYEGWRTCVEQEVFQRYAMKGEISDGASCRKVLLEQCGTNSTGKRTSGRIPSDPVPSASAETVPDSWSQWGGPTGDFKAPAKGIAASWPESGPETLWSRDLGEGNSAILLDAGRLYTMYREGPREIVVCLDASSGETLWEYGYEQATRKEHISAYGNGPSSTPVISGGMLFTIGVAGKMHALNKMDGTVNWSRDLWGENFTGKVQIHGYSSSPLAYGDVVIVPVGGEQAALVAFDQKDGAIKWKAQDFNNSYSSPRLMELAGEEQIVVFMAEELIGVDPINGKLRWRYPHVNQWNHNITVPEVSGDTIFLSSPQAGARGIRISDHEGEMQVEELWSTRRIQFYHGSSVREGDWVYGSTGTVALNFMAAVNIHTGEIGWRQRGFARANCVEADGKVLVLDEDGMLHLTSVTPEKLTVHGSIQLMTGTAWTVPTIVGKILYARNNKKILAVNLG